MEAFAPPIALTIAFCALTLGLVAVELMVLRRAAPPGRRAAWTRRAVVASALWLALHAIIAESGLLRGQSLPPPVGFYLIVTMAFGLGLAISSVGARLAELPLALLVGLQSFRLPLEVILHGLYDAGALPVQMTWSGRNLDVLTGAFAVVLGLWGFFRPLPRRIVHVFNVVGAGLLINVVTIALLSAPLPFRQFMNDPPVVLVFHAPFNWIVNVHVWSALVGHLLIFRALRKPLLSEGT